MPRKKKVEAPKQVEVDEPVLVHTASTGESPKLPKFKVTLMCPPPLGCITGEFEADNETKAQEAAFKAWQCSSSECPLTVTRV